jgi:hypothetical protein
MQQPEVDEEISRLTRIVKEAVPSQELVAPMYILLLRLGQKGWETQRSVHLEGQE